MNFRTGIVIGVFFGANIGLILAGLLAGLKRSDYEGVFKPGLFPMDEAATEDTILTTRFSVDHSYSDKVQSMHMHSNALKTA